MKDAFVTSLPSRDDKKWNHRIGVDMEISYIKKLIKLLDESGIDEIEVEEEGKKVRVSKAHHNSSAVPVFYPQYFPQPGTMSGIPQAASQFPQAGPSTSNSPQADSLPAAEAGSGPKPEEKKYHEVRSPIVGTFYRAPAPNADPYVQVGSTVQQGTVLCIIEAMKLMNEIESDITGKIIQTLVENGKPVEYNQPLFLVEPG
jgi:acetyl-CoA carboxylase biotin carboxyl carrier protein